MEGASASLCPWECTARPLTDRLSACPSATADHLPALAPGDVHEAVVDLDLDSDYYTPGRSVAFFRTLHPPWNIGTQAEDLRLSSSHLASRLLLEHLDRLPKLSRIAGLCWLPETAVAPISQDRRPRLRSLAITAWIASRHGGWARRDKGAERPKFELQACGVRELPSTWFDVGQLDTFISHGETTPTLYPILSDLPPNLKQLILIGFESKAYARVLETAGSRFSSLTTLHLQADGPAPATHNPLELFLLLQHLTLSHPDILSILDVPHASL